MYWLKIALSLISLSMFLYFTFQLLKFRREFNTSIHDDRTLSQRFVQKWTKKYSKGIIFIILAYTFGLLAIFLS